MSKDKLFLGAIIFIILFIIGFCAMGQGMEWLLQLFGRDKTSLPNQANYIVVHVDALENDNPEVISIWGIFAYLNDPVSVKAQPLYPSEGLRGDIVAMNFALASDGLPTPEFINWVKTTYDMQIDNYMVIDDDGVKTFYAQANQIDPQVAISQDTPSDLTLFESGCSRIQEGKLTDKPGSWDLIFPAHFRTNFRFDEFMVQWNTVVSAGADLDCDALLPAE